MYESFRVYEVDCLAELEKYLFEAVFLSEMMVKLFESNLFIQFLLSKSVSYCGIRLGFRLKSWKGFAHRVIGQYTRTFQF